jgi:hypothetical protein
MKDIFSLENRDDLSKEVINNLRLIKAHSKAIQMLELFDIKNELSVDEIIVGLFRKHRVNATREWITSTLYNLRRKNYVKLISKGRYRKVIK